jgi:two-component sensor histidine kinase
LSASELVTNVIRHTDSGGEMRAWDPKPDAPFRLEVDDNDDTPLVRRNPDIDDPTGRGLRVVDGSADEWGVEQTPTGKTVWAEFDRHTSADGS